MEAIDTRANTFVLIIIENRHFEFAIINLRLQHNSYQFFQQLFVAVVLFYYLLYKLSAARYVPGTSRYLIYFMRSPVVQSRLQAPGAQKKKSLWRDIIRLLDFVRIIPLTSLT